jgi:monofunctional biosynthetic peptidoglycan transglycosylase
MPNYEQYRDVTRNSTILGIAVHHSASASRYTGRHSGDAWSIFGYHVHTLGWDHGGYHYVILANGQIQYALDEGIAAYHAGHEDPDNVPDPESGQYWNKHYIAICLAGWFDQDRAIRDASGRRSKIPALFTRPTAAQTQSLLALVQYLRQKHGVPVANVRGHRELGDNRTTCPGSNLDLDQLRQSIVALERTGSDPLSQPIQRVLISPKRGVTATFGLERLTERQKSSLRGLIDSTLRTSARLFLLGLVPALVVVGASSPSAAIVLLRAVLLSSLLTVVPILLLRWFRPPTSAYMQRMAASLRRQGKEDSIRNSWVDYEHIAPVMRLATVAFEDPYFPRHAGFAWGHMIDVWKENRAGRKMRGASTISQQLAKNLFLWPAQTYTRKLVEAYITVLIEAILSKRRILELYLNVIQFDEHVFGVGTAAQHFFDKAAGDLTVEEATLLVAVIPNPNKFHVDSPSDVVYRRQAFTRGKMGELGSDYLDVINAPGD